VSPTYSVSSSLFDTQILSISLRHPDTQILRSSLSDTQRVSISLSDTQITQYFSLRYSNTQILSISLSDTEILSISLSNTQILRYSVFLSPILRYSVFLSPILRYSVFLSPILRYSVFLSHVLNLHFLAFSLSPAPYLLLARLLFPFFLSLVRPSPVSLSSLACLLPGSRLLLACLLLPAPDFASLFAFV
jgi:hypothetical protein